MAGERARRGFTEHIIILPVDRSVDAAGQTLYGGALNAGVSRQQVASIILGSTEYRTNLVHHYYEQYLHRAPQAEEITGFGQRSSCSTFR